MKRGRRNRPEMLGDAPVDLSETESILQSVMAGLDEVFNGRVKGAARPYGIVLFVFEFGDDPHIERRLNYVSNGSDRKDIVVLMKEMIARFEGQPEVSGRA